MLQEMQFGLIIILGLATLSGIILIPQMRFKAEKAQLKSEQERKEKEHELIRSKSEKEIIALKNQQLKTEIAHKNRELAINTMHLVHRNELIAKLQEPLAQILRKTTDKTAITEIKRINKLLKQGAELEATWDQFALHFDAVHIDFLKRLRERILT